MDRDEEARRRALSKEAAQVRAIWLALFKVLRASPNKQRLCVVRPRRCRMRAANAEALIAYAWEAPHHELAVLEHDLVESRKRADAAMLAIGMAGRRIMPDDEK